MYTVASKSTIGYFTVITEACAQKLAFPHLTSNRSTVIIQGFKNFSLLQSKLHFSRMMLSGLSILSHDASLYSISRYTMCKTLVGTFNLEWTLTLELQMLRVKEGLQVV